MAATTDLAGDTQIVVIDEQPGRILSPDDRKEVEFGVEVTLNPLQTSSKDLANDIIVTHNNTEQKPAVRDAVPYADNIAHDDASPKSDSSDEAKRIFSPKNKGANFA